MKVVLICLIYFVLAFPTRGQTLNNAAYYLSYDCNNAESTMDYNICSMQNFIIADSLMNEAYLTIIHSLDRDIIKNRKLSREHKISREDRKFLQKDIDYTRRLRKAIRKSQKKWIQLRNTNAEVIRVSCEGGSSCTQIVNDSMTRDTLERLKSLKQMK